MPVLSFQKSLALLPSPLTSLIIGGTSGIGSGVALALAQHQNMQSRVIIAGRRENAGKEVCESANNKEAIRFKKCDASLIKNIKTFCGELTTELTKKIDVLVLSQGILTFARKDTLEGIETVFAFNYYGRMYFIRELVALNMLAPQCLVINVLNGRAGDPSGKTINFDDMDLRKSGIAASIKQNFAMSDIMIQNFGVEQPEGERRTFIHDYPGFVKTDLVKSIWLKAIFGVTGFFRKQCGGRTFSAEEAGERIVAGGVARLLEDREGGKGYCYMDENGEEIVKCVTDEKIRQKVTDHTWELVDQVLGDGVKHVLNAGK